MFLLLATDGDDESGVALAGIQAPDAPEEQQRMSVIVWARGNAHPMVITIDDNVVDPVLEEEVIVIDDDLPLEEEVITIDDDDVVDPVLEGEVVVNDDVVDPILEEMILVADDEDEEEEQHTLEQLYCIEPFDTDDSNFGVDVSDVFGSGKSKVYKYATKLFFCVFTNS